jgi:hypothetical protein
LHALDGAMMGETAAKTLNPQSLTKVIHFYRRSLNHRGDHTGFNQK